MPLKATLLINNRKVQIDMAEPIDISIQLEASNQNPIAWYLDAPKIEPVRFDAWIGKVSEGASVNFNNVFFNPHAHGTHTECVGHISEKFYSVNEVLTKFFFSAELISVAPKAVGDDHIILKKDIESVLAGKTPEALIIRTLPNSNKKKSFHYSNTNWPYLHKDAAEYIKQIGVKHLLIDLPSVDKEKDDGKLLAHKAFWNYPENPRLDATITEFIFASDEVEDGSYLLNLQMASFRNDASPSKPILYKFL